MADDDVLSDSLSLENHEIDDESFAEANSKEEWNEEESGGSYQGAIQPYMSEPVVDGDITEDDDGGSELDDDTRVQQDVRKMFAAVVTRVWFAFPLSCPLNKPDPLLASVYFFRKLVKCNPFPPASCAARNFHWGGQKMLGRGLGRSPRKFLFDHALYFGYKRDQRLLHRLRSR